jgi:hypothetical protein
MFKKIQGIYVIRNIINDNCYVGQSVDIIRRWCNHKSLPNKSYDYPLYRAFRKYGIDNFEFKVLEYVDNTDDLTNREQFWYDKLEPTYNQVKPVEPISNTLQRAVCMIDKLTLDVIECYVSSAVAGRMNNFDSSTIIKCCKRKKTSYKGAYWCYYEDCDTFVPKVIYRQEKVIRINDETNEIKRYNTINEASKELDISADNIIKCCRGERNRTGGYRWSFEKGNDD